MISMSIGIDFFLIIGILILSNLMVKLIRDGESWTLVSFHSWISSSSRATNLNITQIHSK